MLPDYLSKTFGLNGRLAVVIGGNGALGGAAARALGLAGATVLIVGRNEETCRARVKALRKAKIAADFCTGDARSAGDMEKVLRYALEKMAPSRVDILVNATGSMIKKPFLDLTSDEWSGVIGATLDAVRIPCQVFGRHA